MLVLTTQYHLSSPLLFHFFLTLMLTNLSLRFVLCVRLLLATGTTFLCNLTFFGLPARFIYVAQTACTSASAKIRPEAYPNRTALRPRVR